MECHDWERSEKPPKNRNLSKQFLSNTLGVQYVSKCIVWQRCSQKVLKNIHIDHKQSTVSTHFHPWSLHTTVDYVGIQITNFKNQGY